MNLFSKLRLGNGWGSNPPANHGNIMNKKLISSVNIIGLFFAASLTIFQSKKILSIQNSNITGHKINYSDGSIGIFGDKSAQIIVKTDNGFDYGRSVNHKELFYSDIESIYYIQMDNNYPRYIKYFFDAFGKSCSQVYDYNLNPQDSIYCTSEREILRAFYNKNNKLEFTQHARPAYRVQAHTSQAKAILDRINSSELIPKHEYDLTIEQFNDKTGYALFSLNDNNHIRKIYVDKHGNLDVINQRILQPVSQTRKISKTLSSGTTLEGFLTIPNSISQDSSIVLSLHGGPHDADTVVFTRGESLFLEKNYIVLRVNYRGSIARDLEFRKKIISSHNNILIQEISEFFDLVIQDLKNKPEVKVIYGGSASGYIALDLITSGKDNNQFDYFILVNPVVNPKAVIDKFANQSYLTQTWSSQNKVAVNLAHRSMKNLRGLIVYGNNDNIVDPKLHTLILSKNSNIELVPCDCGHNINDDIINIIKMKIPIIN